MPCPYPGQKEKDADLRAETEHRSEQRDARIERAVKLHLEGEPHHIIMARLGVSRAGLVKWLKAAGLAGNSAKPTPEATDTFGTPTGVRFDEARIDSLAFRSPARLGFD